MGHEIVTLNVSLILIHNDWTWFRINGCSLGEFDFCTTSYPPWLSAKQYTIGEFCSKLYIYVYFKRKSLFSNFIVSKKTSGFSFANFLFPLVILLVTNGCICRWRKNDKLYTIYTDTSTYHGKEYMKLQNGRNFCNSRMPQFAVCFNRLRKYFFRSLYEISHIKEWWILNTEIFFVTVQNITTIQIPIRYYQISTYFSGQFGTTPDLSGEALSITTLAPNL